MNLIYYKAEKGNFGDDLNELIWDELLQGYQDKEHLVDLIGIGSILDKRIEESSNEKIILGSGIRDFLYNPKVNILEDLSFVRGPISSKVMKVPYITDAAYAFALLRTKYKELTLNPKKYKLVYVPYFEQCENFDWSIFEKITNIKVVKPTENMEVFLNEISQAEKVITSAMHGAIMADIFRIPWIRLKFPKQGNESSLTSELKWNDWMQSLEINNPYEIYSDLNLNVNNNFYNSLLKTFILKRKFKYLRFNLSNQIVFESKINELDHLISKIKTRYLL